MIFRIADEYKIADSSFSCYIDGFSDRACFQGEKPVYERDRKNILLTSF